jgi:hypothetical protein
MLNTALPSTASCSLKLSAKKNVFKKQKKLLMPAMLRTPALICAKQRRCF